jgi:hypothetical protein
MYIELFTRDGCRLGANIFNYILQISFAHHNSYYIKYSINNLNYNDLKCNNDSIYFQCLFNYIDEYNKDKINDNIKFIWTDKHKEMTFFLLNILQIVKLDLFSYFKCHIFNNIINNLDILKEKYNIPFNPNKTILIHLRLDDTKNFPDYDGRICNKYYKERINNNTITSNDYNYYDSTYYSHQVSYNRQSPLSTEKILNQIEIVSLKYPNYKKIIITNLGEKHEFPYEYIQSDDPNYDLFLLTQCKVVILSRSNFALSSLFFGNHTDVYIPVWGSTACMGLGTKYDKSNFNYFY